MTFSTSIARLAALAAGFAATAAMAAPEPKGVWIDHTGRGAVEIAECGAALCGHVVWVKDAKNRSSCRTQIIGNAKPVGGNTWDRGWIIDPDDNARYSVELKPVGEDRLRVTGYMGSKLFSETFTWKRAPANLERCDGKTAPVVPAAAPPAAAPDLAPATVTAPIPAPASPPAVIAPAAPAPLQREASAPPAASIEAAPDLTPVAPAPATVETEPQPEPRAARRAGGKRKSASRDCKLELPYITLSYPCDAF